jgi:hypothetical protein
MDGLMPIVLILIATDISKILIFNFSLGQYFKFKIPLYFYKLKLSVNNINMIFMFANLILFSVCYNLINNTGKC